MRTTTEFRKSIEMSVPPESVWAAWTDPVQILAWWSDHARYRMTSWESDLREGGRWRARGVNADDDSYSVEGFYLRIRAPHELTFTWRPSWSDEPESEVRIQIEVIPDSGCRLTLVHRVFADEDASAPQAVE